MQIEKCKMLEYVFKTKIIILTFAFYNLHFSMEQSDYLALRKISINRNFVNTSRG